jgi:kynurenine formamidase
LDWEDVHGTVPAGAFIFMNSGWSSKWSDQHKFFGSADPSNTTSLHFPGFDADTVRFLISERFIRGVGVDTPSVDFGQDLAFTAHGLLARSSLVGLEYVAYLDKMPSAGAHVFLLPIKIAGGSGSPTRIIGILPAEN